MASLFSYFFCLRPSRLKGCVLTLSKVIFVLVSIISSCGCSPGVGTSFMLGAAFSAGMLSRQERNVREVVDDVAIWASIKNRFFKNQDRSIFRGVSVEVTEGRVLLTGGVSTQGSKLEAVRISWEVEGVVEVTDKISVMNEKVSFQSTARDTLIAAQIRAALMMDGSVRSMNYTVDVFGGTVYVAGIARNKEELKKVHSIIRDVNGVQKLESYVRIKPRHSKKDVESAAGSINILGAKTVIPQSVSEINQKESVFVEEK